MGIFYDNSVLHITTCSSFLPPIIPEPHSYFYPSSELTVSASFLHHLWRFSLFDAGHLVTLLDEGVAVPPKSDLGKAAVGVLSLTEEQTDLSVCLFCHFRLINHHSN